MLSSPRQLRATLTEVDSMGDRLGSISKLLKDYGDEGVSFVTGAIEDKFEEDDSSTTTEDAPKLTDFLAE